MKVLMKKIKLASGGMKFFYFFSLILYIVTYVFFVINVISLQGIETLIRILILVFFGLFGILFAIFGLTSLIQKKKKIFIPFVVFALLFSITFGISSYFISKLYNRLESFTQSDTSTYTTVLLTLKDTEITSDSILGMINNESNRENYILAKEMIKEKNIKNEINDKDFDDIYILVSALYNGEVDGIFITKDYPVLLGNEEKYQNILSETKVVESYSKKMKTEESNIVSNKSLTEPFTILVLGVDSENTDRLDPNAAFNGDTLMLITFNPKTLSATIFSVPRDLYVPISCNGNRYNKVNAAAYGGTSCVMDTINNLTDIDIDYFVKVDFKAVVDLVETIGGIDVEVEAPDYDYYNSIYGGRLCEQNSLRQFGEHLICMETGMQHLNGEQALAYARNRHGYLESDIARNRHQQQVIEALAKKLVKTSSFSDFENILDTISRHIATNMKTTQILSFYQTIKNMLTNALSGQDFITIQRMQLTYYNLEVNGTSALGYYSGSMKAITEAMEENLGIKQIETIKTFAYDYYEDNARKKDIVGLGIYSGSKLNFLPSFVGRSVSEAKSFANNNDLSLNIEYIEDKTQMNGIILKQSVAPGTITDNISGFTIYVNEIKNNDNDTSNTKPNKETNNKDDKEEDEDTQNNSSTTNNDNKEDNNTNTDNDTDESNTGNEETPDNEENDNQETSPSTTDDPLNSLPGSPTTEESEDE